MFFTEKNRKKNLILSFLTLFLFLGVIFAFSDVQPAHAFKDLLGCEVGAGFTDCLSSGGDISNAGDNFIVAGFKWLLYGIFVMFGWIASLAVTIFAWAINPKNVGILFNDPGVYESWKFVRDFFNLFFILVLLYIAFSVVFQIEKNFKKTILSLVLAALFVNFSFPVSRALIDATNVPMYFFSNQMMASNTASGTGVMGAALTASNIKGILVPGSEKGGTFNTSSVSIERLLMAIVFIFIFSITLLVLSIMFVIRLVALVVLVIFSSVGFVASVVPGLRQYSGMWWDNFLKYAIFGPAAMLMLLIATRFFASIGDANGPLMASMQSVAGSNVVGVDRGFFASMALFTIPIIMLWMAMGLAQKMSIAGASSVVGMGQKVSKWVGRQPINGAKWVGLHNPVSNSARGVGQGLKSRFADSKLGSLLASPSKFEARGKGLAKGLGTEKGVSGAIQSEYQKMHQKEVNERVKKDKDNQVNNSTHRNNLENSKDPVEREASALALAADKEIRTAEELSLAADALKNNNDGLLKVIESAKPEAIGGLDSTSHASIQDAFYKKEGDGKIAMGADGKPVIREGMQNAHDAYSGKLKKEGNAKIKVDYEINQKGVKAGDVSESANTIRQEVYKSNFDKMGAEDFAKQKGIYTDPAFQQYAQGMGSKRIEAILDKAIEKGGEESQKEWIKIAAESNKTRRESNTKGEGSKIIVEEGYRTRKA